MGGSRSENIGNFDCHELIFYNGVPRVDQAVVATTDDKEHLYLVFLSPSIFLFLDLSFVLWIIEERGGGFKLCWGCSLFMGVMIVVVRWGKARPWENRRPGCLLTK